MEKVVFYQRVSRVQQSEKHGLDAQKAIVEDYAKKNNLEIIGEYTEVESGANKQRPVLKTALSYCELTGCKLIIARLDRLSRSLSFLGAILDSGVEIVICDFPNASRFVINVLGCVAEYELERIRERTKNGLNAAKAKGIKLGKACHQNRDDQAFEAGRKTGATTNKCKADQFSKKVIPIIEVMCSGQPLSYTQIARNLTDKNILTARRKKVWTAQAVKNLLARVDGNRIRVVTNTG